jgi:hypothetical protein
MGLAEKVTMEGFGRWDLVVWIVAAYIAVMALVRMMLYSLKSAHRRNRIDPPNSQPRELSATGNEQPRRAA